MPSASAHKVLSRAIELNERPGLAVIMHELRARIRCVLNLWFEASEDVRAALRGLEEAEVVGCDDLDSEEEREKLSVPRFWGTVTMIQRGYQPNNNSVAVCVWST